MAATEEAARELPDTVTEDILLRLDAGADVVRASATCRAYRRVACDLPFLRRVRLRPPHPPPVLGAFAAEPLLGDGGGAAGSPFHPAAPPHPSASAALAVARAADLAFSFLPDPAGGAWRVRDVRDGRVLLSRSRRRAAAAGGNNSDDLVVCDPLHRRYIQIPHVPKGLANSPRRYGALELELFLAPAAADSALQVIANALCARKMGTLVFSSATGEWRHAAMFNCNGDRYARIKDDLASFARHYANGCFYWTHHNRDVIIVLDTRAMEFSFSTVYRPSALRLPECRRRQSLAVVDAGGDGKPCLVAVVGTRMNVYWLQSVYYGTWRHEKTTLLPEGYHWYVMGASEGVLLLRGRHSQSEEMADSQYFTMDLQTWSLEWMCTTDHTIMLNHLYAKHPPPLSPPSISDGENHTCWFSLLLAVSYIATYYI
ncbi:unnamed protein product [Urochloa decumbens]|uniref:F-box domain-containing protein n=1 Tax=Urochloa decumbens TaxID=240449 RepID=A0ABC9GFI4_9POAL